MIHNLIWTYNIYADSINLRELSEDYVENYIEKNSEDFSPDQKLFNINTVIRALKKLKLKQKSLGNVYI